MDNIILKINDMSKLKELDGSTRVARYFSHKKLEDFINTEQLYFRNCELFDDDNERKRIDRGKYKTDKGLCVAEKIQNHKRITAE